VLGVSARGNQTYAKQDDLEDVAWKKSSRGCWSPDIGRMRQAFLIRLTFHIQHS